ncbi:MAG: hypothetical protein ACYC60_18875 [Thermoanaerobaculia bacterium]
MFYAGVFFCGMLAIAAAVQAFFALGVAGPISAGTSLTVAVIVLFATVPVSALLLRMASLLAARNLFGALFATFAIACAAVASGVFAVLQIHNALISQRLAGVMDALPIDLSPVPAQLIIATGYATAFFLAIALLALRPYFQVQSSRYLSMLVVIPIVAFAWVLSEQVIAGALAIMRSRSFVVSMELVAVVFVSIAVHSLRHRPLFVEVTNLRELLDPRLRVAFDS